MKSELCQITLFVYSENLNNIQLSCVAEVNIDIYGPEICHNDRHKIDVNSIIKRLSILQFEVK